QPKVPGLVDQDLRGRADGEQRAVAAQREGTQVVADVRGGVHVAPQDPGDRVANLDAPLHGAGDGVPAVGKGELRVRDVGAREGPFGPELASIHIEHTDQTQVPYVDRAGIAAG